jgi:hypothetical protein
MVVVFVVHFLFFCFFVVVVLIGSISLFYFIASSRSRHLYTNRRINAIATRTIPAVEKRYQVG